MKQGCRVVAILILGAVVRTPPCVLAAERRPFTVKDSIELTTFSDPYTRAQDAECKISPNGKYFFVITTKGNLQTNQLESTVWLYSASEIKQFLQSKNGTAPKPEQLFRLAGSPVAQEYNSYGSLITKAQWSSDSRSVLFLDEQTSGQHHLFRTNPFSKRSVDLTPGDKDITDFSEAGGTVAYLVAEHMHVPKVIGMPINDASSDLTGLSLFHIMFPQTFPDSSSFWPALDLWVRYRGVSRQVNAGGKWNFPSAASGLRLAVSPNGRALIAAQPVPVVPAEWSRYKTVSNQFGFTLEHTGTDRSGKALNWPWQYIYVKLDGMTVAPLVDAPSGDREGYTDSLQVVWAQDSQHVLFTNSYLPLQQYSDLTGNDRLQPCSAAIFTVASRVTECIAYARFPGVNESLRSLTFGASSDAVILHWFGEGKTDLNIYERTPRGWILRPQSAIVNKPEPELKIYIQQDINEPPTLWATEPTTGLRKELWNPNPQLASVELGRASVYTWKDSTGYDWHAGLVLPPDFKSGHRYPLVIQTHGFYNEHEFLVDGSFTTGFAARALAASGIVVLQMDDRADRHVQPTQKEALLAVDGFESAVEHLDQDGLIDPSRVGIIGFSRTAWYVEEALIHAPHLFRAATLIDGIDQSYLTYMLFAPGNPEAAAEQEAANLGKPFGTGLQHWVKNSAGFNLNEVQSPVRIEALGPISVLGEWEIYSSLYQQGKPVDLVYISGAQHILQKPQDRYASQQGNVDWFRFWLQGYERPNPEKSDQYKRWERLRDLQDAASKVVDTNAPKQQ